MFNELETKSVSGVCMLYFQELYLHAYTLTAFAVECGRDGVGGVNIEQNRNGVHFFLFLFNHTHTHTHSPLSTFS